MALVTLPAAGGISASATTSTSSSSSSFATRSVQVAARGGCIYTGARTRPGAGTLSRGNSLYHSNPLAAYVPMAPTPAAAAVSTVRSSLIEPDGGALVDLVVPPEERAARKAEAARLPRVGIGAIDLEWVHVISEGWASPLRGFMREEEYLQSLHFNRLRLEDGSVVNMSLPIVLAIGDADKAAIGESPDVALAGPGRDLVAILRR